MAARVRENRSGALTGWTFTTARYGIHYIYMYPRPGVLPFVNYDAEMIRARAHNTPFRSPLRPLVLFIIPFLLSRESLAFPEALRRLFKVAPPRRSSAFNLPLGSEWSRSLHFLTSALFRVDYVDTVEKRPTIATDLDRSTRSPDRAKSPSLGISSRESPLV